MDVVDSVWPITRQHLFFHMLLIFQVQAGLLLSLLEKIGNLHWGQWANLKQKQGDLATIYSVLSGKGLCSVLCSLLALVKPLKAVFLPYKVLLLFCSVCLHIPCGNSPWETGVLSRNGCPSYFLSCCFTMVLISLNF